MKRDKISELLNPNEDAEVEFHIEAAIEHIKSKTHQSFEVDGELDLPFDLVQAVKFLVDSISESGNVASESVGGELSVTYFDHDIQKKASEYWRPYRKLAW